MTPAEDQYVLILAGVHVVGFWLLVWYVFRLRRRLRCLGFCYISLGDWGINRLIEAKDYYIDVHGQHVTPFILLEAEQQFQYQLENHRRYFKEVGLEPPGQRELNYPLETMG